MCDWHKMKTKNIMHFIVFRETLHSPASSREVLAGICKSRIPSWYKKANTVQLDV